MEPELPIPTPNGFDTMIAARNVEWADFLPEGAEVTLLGQRTALIDETKCSLTPDQLLRASILLRRLVVEAVQMGGLPQRPQVAWFTVTRDPEIIARYGAAHDCPDCRAGVDRSLAHLRKRPFEPLLVGVLAF